MLKKKLPRRFNLSLLLLLFGAVASAQETIKKEGCYILAEKKHIPLFTNLTKLRKNITVYKDIENLNKSLFLYGYDEKISKINAYTITPQILFFVDTGSNQIVRCNVEYSIERSIKDGDILKADLYKFLAIIKNQTVPFLQLPLNPDFGFETKVKSDCYTYILTITKPKTENSATSQREVVITVSFAK
jgi:hypothetical protein